MTIWKLLMLLKVPWKDFKILLRHGEGWERNNNKMCSNFRDLRNDTNYWNQCSAFPLALCDTLSCNLESLLPSLSELYLLFQRFAITIISITSSCQPEPKRRNATNERNEKSLSIIRICWHMTVPWHFNFCNKQTLKRQLNIFCVPTVLTRQDERGERFPGDILEGSDF